MRLTVGDSETTGGSMRLGDRCIEFAVLEWREAPTGKHWQSHFNPQGRAVHWGAQRVHGLTNRFLADKPNFRDKMPELLDFIGDSVFLAHNARFDAGVLSVEMHHAGIEGVEIRCLDTIGLARRVLRLDSMSLDALQRHFGIEADRKLHGALIDSQILCSILERLQEMRPGFLEEAVADTRGLQPIVASARAGRILLGLESASPARRRQAPMASGSAGDAPIAMDTAGPAPARPLEAGSDVHPLLAAAIDEINRSDAPLGDDLYRRLRSGRDAWSSASMEEVIATCNETHGEEKVGAAVADLDEAKRKAALRWICRGLDPSRSAELVEFYDRRERDRCTPTP